MNDAPLGFEQFDVDGDGLIDGEEFLALVTRLGLRRAGPIMQQLFDSIDSDGDGRISRAEFETWWARDHEPE